jgi:DNA gyrase subunit A
MGDEEDGDVVEVVETSSTSLQLPPKQIEAMAAQEEFILTVTNRGFGKRSSSYEYRSTGRGGQGVTAIDLTERNGLIVDSFPVSHTDDIMLVTDQGQTIRCPVKDIRIAGRRTQGVTLFRVSQDESVVSVARIAETEDDSAEDAAEGDIFVADTASNNNAGAPEADV